MWQQNWRSEIWSQLDQEWDLLIVGGGITGAGILREASHLGLKALLVDQRDFGWGTSSRSSKFVHGGLRYLKEGQIGLTRESVHEREHLLNDGPGLVEPIGFLLATYKRDKIGRLVYRAGLSIYDLLALQWSHKYYSAADFQMFAPHIEFEGLKGGFQYRDAQTDDARLVLRLIREAVAHGRGHIQALNYTAAQELLRDDNGRVCGVMLADQETGQSTAVQAKVVINATGTWADELRAQVGGEAKIRPLRGSHLIFSNWRLPVAQVVTFLHPIDQRPVMIFPWEGTTIVGTTDVDHHSDLQAEPCISATEVAYLMAAVASEFPSLNIQVEDIIATFAGIRPVIGTGKLDPSEESRDHVVLVEKGLLTVTGGKLTTFRIIARDALQAIQSDLPQMPPINEKAPILYPAPTSLPGADGLAANIRRRLLGRYGSDAPALIAAAQPGELEPIAQSPVLWAEIRWAARAEGVIHLDDLLLRRVRLGLLLPQGGQTELPRIAEICRQELGWDEARWTAEEAVYTTLWQRCYNLPPLDEIPDWHNLIKETEVETATSASLTAGVTIHHPTGRKTFLATITVLTGLTLLLLLLINLKKRR
ncbi:MAG: glycerol-3-phosphate dehydrogenase/oxidase [Chloroflexi bacterium]|nr:glycerol-3-phosphate dehydrogenase/oxidase [Chloroflexota bacterium]